MTARDFCFWLQGALELNPPKNGFTPKQVDILQKHLSLAFAHEIDPSMGGADHQAVLDSIHNGPTVTEGKSEAGTGGNTSI